MKAKSRTDFSRCSSLRIQRLSGDRAYCEISLARHTDEGLTAGIKKREFYVVRGEGARGAIPMYVANGERAGTLGTMRERYHPWNQCQVHRELVNWWAQA